MLSREREERNRRRKKRKRTGKRRKGRQCDENGTNFKGKDKEENEDKKSITELILQGLVRVIFCHY